VSLRVVQSSNVCRLKCCELKYGAPEGIVGIGERDSEVPRFVAAPDDFAFRAAAAFGTDEADVAAQRKIRGNNRHASGTADVNGDSIGLLARLAFFPFNQEFHAGGGASVRAKARPAFLKFFLAWYCGIHCSHSHGKPRRKGFRPGGAKKKVATREADVNGTFTKKSTWLAQSNGSDRGAAPGRKPGLLDAPEKCMVLEI